MTKYAIDPNSIRDVKTSVSIHGSTKQAETGGPICLGVVIGVAIYLAK